MNTFLPYPLYSNSAKCLDNKRLGKQRVECLQILNTLAKGEFHYDVLYYYGTKPKRTPWYNHPAVQMWKGFESQLAIYGLYICNEWIKRGFKDTYFEKIHSFIPKYQFIEENCIDYSGCSANLYPTPKWLGDNKFHSSHRAALLFKKFDYYKQFEWQEKPEINYLWPKIV